MIVVVVCSLMQVGREERRGGGEGAESWWWMSGWICHTTLPTLPLGLDQGTAARRRHRFRPSERGFLSLAWSSENWKKRSWPTVSEDSTFPAIVRADFLTRSELLRERGWLVEKQGKRNGKRNTRKKKKRERKRERDDHSRAGSGRSMVEEKLDPQRRASREM